MVSESDPPDDYDPWAEAEAAVSGKSTPKKPASEPAPQPQSAQPEPAEPESAGDADPWAEAEAAVSGKSVPKPAAPKLEPTPETDSAEPDPTDDADPWAEAAAAVGADAPAETAAPAGPADTSSDNAGGADDPWAEAAAAVGEEAPAPDSAPEPAPAGAGEPDDGDDPWAEAEAAAGQAPDAAPAAAADDGGDAKSWAAAVRAAAAAKQRAADQGAEPAAEAPNATEAPDVPTADEAERTGLDPRGPDPSEAAQPTSAGSEPEPEPEPPAAREPAGGPPDPPAEPLPEPEPNDAVEAAELVPFGADEALDARVRSIAALLFASPEALSDVRLVELLDEVSRAEAKQGIAQLQARLQAAGLPFECRAVAGGWRLFTEAALGEVVARLARQRKAERLSQAGLETLAIIAYRQPVTKAEIEAIRGVQAGPMLRTLADRGLVRVAGRADQPGAPLLYATTKDFLDRFGLASLKDLPRDAELARG